MTEIERRQQPIQHPRRQERRAPITIFVEDYLKLKRECQTKKSCETDRLKEIVEKRIKQE